MDPRHNTIKQNRHCCNFWQNQFNEGILVSESDATIHEHGSGDTGDVKPFRGFHLHWPSPFHNAIVVFLELSWLLHPGDFHNLHTCTQPILRSFHSKSGPGRFQVSLSCHSCRTVEISKDGSCPPRRSIQLPTPPPLSISRLVFKNHLTRPTRSLNSGSDVPATPRPGLRTFILFLFSPDLDRFLPFPSTPADAFFSRISVKSLSKLSDFALMLCIICQMFVQSLCGLPISRFHEYMYSSSSLHKLRLRFARSLLCFVHVLLHFFKECSCRSFLFLVFTELLQSSPESGSGHRHHLWPLSTPTFRFYRILLFLFSNCPCNFWSAVPFFSLTSIPSSPLILWALCIFDGGPLPFGFRVPVLWWPAGNLFRHCTFEYRNVFLTLDVGGMETRKHFAWDKNATKFQWPPNLSLVICPAPHSLISKGILGVCDRPNDKRERSLNCLV